MTIPIVIPGRADLTICHLVLDFNGTLAQDGRVAPSTVTLLKDVAARVHTMIVTADTFGTVKPFAQALGMECHIIRGTADKRVLVESLDGAVVAIGNGANDQAMFEAANLAICVIGTEGAHRAAINASDIVTHTIDDALALLLHPDRLVATLRE